MMNTASLSGDALEEIYNNAGAYWQKKADRIWAAEKRKEILGSAALLERSLSIYLGTKDLSEHLDNVKTGKYGKPEFSLHPDVHFNLSHSGGWAMCIISSFPAGCDIEKVRIDKDGPDLEMRIAQRFFTPAECEMLSRNDKCMPLNFYRLWTLKESYIKAIGTGLSTPLRSVGFSLHEEGEPEIILPEDTPDGIYVREIDAPDGFAAAACSIGCGFESCDIRTVEYEYET